MILGVGLDLVSMPRIKGLASRHGQRFLERCFVPGEVSADLQDPANLAVLAQAWSLKEAFLKALGGSIKGIPYQDITVRVGRDDRHVVTARGRAGCALENTGAGCVLALSSVTWPWVVGTVILSSGESRKSKGLGGDDVV